MGRAVSVLLAIALVLVLMASCRGVDPFGATTREEIRSQAAVRIADIEARAAVERTALQAQASQANARIWAQTLPVVALIAIGGLLFAIVLYFRGKVALLQLSAMSPPALPHRQQEIEWMLRSYATRTNQLLEYRNHAYFLTDPITGKTIRAQPKQIGRSGVD